MLNLHHRLLARCDRQGISMTALWIITAVISSVILTLLVFAPFEPIDLEIRDALNYDAKQEAIAKAISK